MRGKLERLGGGRLLRATWFLTCSFPKGEIKSIMLCNCLYMCVSGSLSCNHYVSVLN